MVERDRDEGEAIALTTAGGGGQLQEEGAVVASKAEGGERDGKERDAEEEREEEKKDRDDGDDEEWSEIRLAIAELSPEQLKRRRGRVGGGDEKPAASSPPTLPFLAVSHLLLRVLDKIGPTMAVLRLDVQRNIEITMGFEGD